MAKDKIFGFFIMILGIVIIIFYIFWAPLSLIYHSGVGLTGWTIFNVLRWEWALVIPMTLAVVLVGLLAAWIGYSMITTPPPVPLEELEEELEAEEAAAKTGEAKKESTPDTKT